MTNAGRVPHGADQPLPQRVDVLVVGAGQAGLDVRYWLKQHPGPTVLAVDAEATGESWVQRWDSLQLSTPRCFSALPGMRSPRGGSRTPTRLEMAACLRR